MFFKKKNDFLFFSNNYLLYLQTQERTIYLIDYKTF